MKRLLCAGLALALTSCTLGHELPPATAGPLDSTLRAAGLPAGKLKFTGPVTLQIGGTNNTATAVAKATAPLATAPHAVATEAPTRAGTPWAVLVGVLLVLGLALAWVRGKFPFSI